MADDPHGGELETIRFGTLDIHVDGSVLRPRPWTAAQSRWIADLLTDAPDGDVLELCTGAGQIGLLAVAGTARRLVAVDADPRAVQLARYNAERAGLAGQVDIRQGALEQALAPTERFPVAIADPPWVRSVDVDRLPEDPPRAIDGGVDGLDLARRCLEVLDRHLVPGGVAVVQLGSAGQADVLAAWAREHTRLVLGEVRVEEGGVLVRADLPR